MAGRRLTIEIIGDASKFASAAKSAGGDAEKLGGKLDDLGSTAAGLKGIDAAKFEAGFADVGAGADATKAALAAIDSASFDSVVARVRGVDSSLREIEGGSSAARASLGDLEAKGTSSLSGLESKIGRLTAELKQLDGAASGFDGIDQGARVAGGGMDQLAKRTDNTRSVVANFAGNATQELPGVAGAMGPLNMAMGQFAEYAAEGNVKLSSFVQASAGLGLASVALMAVSSHMKAIAETKAWKREEVEGYSEALREAETAAEAIRLKLTEAGKVEFTVANNTADVTASLGQVGVTVDTLTKAVEGGEPGIQALGAALIESGQSSQIASDVMMIARQQLDLYGRAAKEAAVEDAFYGKTVLDTSRQVDAYSMRMTQLARNVDATAASEEAAKQKTEAAKEAHQRAWQAVQDRIAAEAALRGELLLSVGGQQGYEQQVRNAASALDGYNEKTNAGTLSQRDLETEAYNVSQTMLETARAYAESKGAAEGSKQQADLMKESLGGLAGQLGPGDPLRSNLDGYIRDLDNIPRNINTVLGIEIKGKNVKVTPTGDLSSNFDDQKRARALGGPVSAGEAYLVGERGPEIAVFGRNGYVIPNDRISVAAPAPASRFASAGEVHIHIHQHIAGNMIHSQDAVREIHDGIVDGVRRGALTGIQVGG